MLASSGEVDLYTLQKLLTHNSPEMTQRYAHLADEALHRAFSVAASFFLGWFRTCRPKMMPRRKRHKDENCANTG